MFALSWSVSNGSPKISYQTPHRRHRPPPWKPIVDLCVFKFPLLSVLSFIDLFDFQLVLSLSCRATLTVNGLCAVLYILPPFRFHCFTL